MTGGVSVDGSTPAVGSGSTRRPTLEVRIRISQTRQIGGSRTRIEIDQQSVIPGFGFQLAHTTVRVVHIAEHDGVGGADGFACRDDLAVPQRPVLFFSLNLGRVDPLDAVGALL